MWRLSRGHRRDGSVAGGELGFERGRLQLRVGRVVVWIGRNFVDEFAEIANDLFVS